MKMQKIGIVILFLTTCISCTKKFDASDNTFYTYTRENVYTLDPIHAHDLFSHQMSAQVYEGLYHFHYLKRPLEVEPLLAKTLPTISADGKTYTIKLKENIYFHASPAFNGPRLFVAEDFIYSLRRLADPKNRSESFWVLENKIVGLDEWRKKITQGTADYYTPISGLKALDPHTLQIQLNQPNYQFLQTLTMAATFVVAREAVEYYGSEFGSHAVGTGAFQLDSWLRGSQLRFSKNPSYNTISSPSGNADEGKTLPFVDRLVVYEIPEAQPQFLLFLKGDIDILQPHKDYQSEFIKNAKLNDTAKKKGFVLELPPSVDVVYVGFNTENPFLKNKKIRQAFSLVFDRNISIDKFYNFLAIPSHGPIPPGLDGYDANRKSMYTDYNLELAKKHLAEAGFPHGEGLPEFNYELNSTNTVARQQAEFLKNQLALLGVKIRLNANTWPQFNDKLKKKKADIFEQAWNADYADPENFFQLFYSKNISPGPNFSNFKNKTFDTLYEKSKNLPPSLARTSLYIEMEKFLMEECPWIFHVHRLRPLIKQPWLKNYQFEIMIADTMKYYKVDAPLRAQLKEQR
ncbi:hypothetical protein K2X05_03690 [bacterium]|nr:hypothetical protein [bacterium]